MLLRPGLGLGHVHEALLDQELHGGDDAVLREVFDDHRSGHPTRLLLLVLGGRDAGRVGVLPEDRVELLVVGDVPGGDRLAEERVGDEEPGDPIHHAEFLPLVVRVVDAVVAGFHLRDRLLPRVTVSGVTDAGLQEDGDEGLLAVTGRERPVECDLPEEAKLAGQHPLVLAQGRGQVGSDVADVLGHERVASQIRQHVPGGHGGLVAAPRPRDLGGQVADVGPAHLGDRVAEVQQRVVPVHLVEVRVALQHRGRVGVEEVHCEHARQHRPPLAVEGPLVEAHDGQETAPVDHVEHVLHVDQGDPLVQEGRDGAEGDVVRLAVDHDHLGHVHAGHQVGQDAVDHRLVLAHRHHHVGVATQTQEGLALVEPELVGAGLVEVGQGGPVGDFAVAGERLTVPVPIGAAGLFTLDLLVGTGRHGSLLWVLGVGSHYFSRTYGWPM